MNTNPRARREGVIVERLGDEVLIFDETSTKGHCLTGNVARVWDLLDGTRTLEAVAQELSTDVAEVELALTEMSELGLLDEQTSRYSRRDLSKKAAKVAVAAPIIYSLSVAPAAATPISCAATSCSGDSQQAASEVCKKSANCRSQSTCLGVTNPITGAVSNGQCVF